MRVDVAASRRLRAAIARADRAALRDPGTPPARASARRAARLRAQRRRVDERFDPARALAATARYLKIAREKFGREDLAFVSYHMGIGNLDGVIRDFAGPGAADLPYAQLYFDSTPLRHAAAYRRLASFGDDSSTYYWRLLAARDIMRAYRRDRGGLGSEAARRGAEPSAARALHPPGCNARLRRPGGARRRARRRHASCRSRPIRPSADVAPGPELDALARRLGQPADRYRLLRPAALDALRYLGAGVAAVAPGSPAARGRPRHDRPAVRRANSARTSSRRRSTAPATPSRSRGATAADAQAEAVQFMLDRLTAMNLIAWSRAGPVLEITAASDAGGLASWLDRAGRLRDAG